MGRTILHITSTYFTFLETSHPISVPVNVPDEINEIFDTISYQKGGSVIRMMANFLQLSTFNQGTQSESQRLHLKKKIFFL
jgi:aminopeptidase N